MSAIRKPNVTWFTVGLAIGVTLVAVVPGANKLLAGAVDAAVGKVTPVAAAGGDAFCRVEGSMYYFRRDFETSGYSYDAFEAWCTDRYSLVEFNH